MVVSRGYQAISRVFLRVSESFKGYIRTQWRLRESQGHLRYFKGVLRDLRSISRRSHGISEDTSMSQGCLRGSSFGSVANQYCAKENV